MKEKLMNNEITTQDDLDKWMKDGQLDYDFLVENGKIIIGYCGSQRAYVACKPRESYE